MNEESYKHVYEAAILMHAKVFIKKTREHGFEEFAICLNSKPDFWINSFEKKKQAKKHVRELGLTLVKE